MFLLNIIDYFLFIVYSCNVNNWFTWQNHESRYNLQMRPSPIPETNDYYIQNEMQSYDQQEITNAQRKHNKKGKTLSTYIFHNPTPRTSHLPKIIESYQN